MTLLDQTLFEAMTVTGEREEPPGIVASESAYPPNITFFAPRDPKLRAVHETAILGDPHLGTPSGDTEPVTHLIREAKASFPDKLFAKRIFIMGDTFDVITTGVGPSDEFMGVPIEDIPLEAYEAEMKRMQLTEPQRDFMRVLRDEMLAGAEIIHFNDNHGGGCWDKFIGSTYMGIRVVQDAVWQTKSGKKYFMTHGNKYDPPNSLINMLCCKVYNALLLLDTKLNQLAAWMYLQRVYYAQFFKEKFKKGIGSFFSHYRENALAEGENLGCSAVIMGHTHCMVFSEDYINPAAMQACPIHVVFEYKDGTIGITDRLPAPPKSEKMTLSQKIGGAVGVPVGRTAQILRYATQMPIGKGR